MTSNLSLADVPNGLKRRQRKLCLPGFFLLLTLAAPAWGGTGPAPASAESSDLTDMSLEALMDINVTSVSRKSQKLANAAAAVFVITQEDIKRSGVTTIADALRLAPGVEVARMDSSKWAVSIRGFNGRYANKLLVLMDGRSLYTPFFSGVYWEVQDTPLEDIERIEVIRGPGAVLWGANAVNGVINITTKRADSTLGGFVSAGGGTRERGFGTARYGFVLGEATDLRLYAKYNNRDSGVDAAGNATHDDWNITRGGFRLDSHPTEADQFTLQGDYYDGKLEETYTLFLPPTLTPPTVVDVTSGVSGGNLITRWKRTLSEKSSLSLQVYFDHYERQMFITAEKRNSVDLDFQHRFSLWGFQDVIWGAGYRYSQDEFDNTFTASFTPPSRDEHLYSAFLHDEITLVPERLALILGTRVERKDYSGFEVQPNGRLLWTPTPRQTVWAAVSRAVRTPSRAEQTIQYRQGAVLVDAGGGQQIPLVARVTGSRSYRSEDLLAYELGYRCEPHPRISFDIAAFYNIYKHLRTLTTGALIPPSATEPFATQPAFTSNDMNAHTVGVELSSTWRPYDWWRLQATYSYLNIAAHLDTPDPTIFNVTERGNASGDSPRHQFSLRSGVDVGREVTFDLWLRGVDRLEFVDLTSIPGYITLDTRLAWKPRPDLEIALVGQNLLHEHNQEFFPELINTVSSHVERGFYGKITWAFR
ncbi:MAG TPA: TonB-dependent receptor [Geobacteraceae bacterium]